MLKFTTEMPTPLSTSSLVVLKETIKGHVDILVQDKDQCYCRLASLGNGKLHVYPITLALARNIGLELDSEHFPIIELH